MTTERIFTPWNIVSFGIVGIMYLVYLDFGRGDTMGQSLWKEWKPQC